MSLVSTYVRAIDGKWYQNPVLEGKSESGHRWFLCFDDDDPPEFVYEVGERSAPRDAPPSVLALAGIDFSNLRRVSQSGRPFGGEYPHSEGYFMTINKPIPVPSRFDAVFDEKPKRDGCYYGFEPKKVRR